VGSIQGMSAACRALDFPVVSGNVSLYNETNGQAIQPTPAIGAIGLIDDLGQTVRHGLAADLSLVLVGETAGHLGSTLYLREVLGREDGPPPPVDLAAERRNGDFVRTAIRAGTIKACHDVSDGGLLVAVADMAMATGVGAHLTVPAGQLPYAFLFGEDQARYVVALAPEAVTAFEADARAAGVPVLRLGQTSGAQLTVEGHGTISIADLKSRNEAWLPAYMARP
jgi:phosphoribosylformylglycinamidine synthase